MEKWAYMHIPRTGGTSLTSALVAALGEGSLGRVRFDVSMFGEFDSFDELKPEIRETIAVTADDLEAARDARLIAGHFFLSTLEKVVPCGQIFTFLRDPRERILSQYLYWQLRTRDAREHWLPHNAADAAQGPFAEFVENPSVAASVDNVICRMALGPDRRLPTAGFLVPRDAKEVAEEAVCRLKSLGYVGILERSDESVRGLSKFLGVPLSVGRENATPSGTSDREAMLASEPHLSASLESRIQADSLVYEAFNTRL